MIVIPGYELIEVIHQGAATVIYRGTRQKDQMPAIVKILIAENPTLADIAHIKQEYSIPKNLNIEGIVKPLSLENYQNRLVLVLEDFGGISLKKLSEQGFLDLSTFFDCALQLVETLGHLHTHRIIHKDIKPKNIIVNSKTGIVKITDFGIATQLFRETQQISNPELLEGTLAYMSPEQTGRMNRIIDYRTDFYSLGVSFYEILTGTLPFNSKEPLELVYSHIAQTPTHPHQLNADIPPVLSSIVMKLMAKNAEERYQSAAGLKADLEKCLSALQSTGKIDDFVPGKMDKSGQLSIPQKLYGRELEVKQLLDAFARVVGSSEFSVWHSKIEEKTQKLNKDDGNDRPYKIPNTRSEMMLVSGYSGIGKSSLVNEVHKPIVRERGYFIAGKFDQFKRDIPYASIIQAFQDLMRQLLTESTEKLQIWKDKLLAALGTNGQVIVDVIPEVELIIGKQPEVPQLGPTESQNRFNRVFQDFIHVFTQPQHPLVLFLDDLQWADAASLKLIQLLMTEQNSQYLLLIGAYRDNEVSPAHPLMHTIYEIEQAEAIVNKITLYPLEIGHVRQIIADTLYDSEQSIALANLLFHKTQGNPFFLTQMLKTLYQEQLLSFDFSKGIWLWDIEQIQAFGITDLGVVELVANNIRKLSQATQEALKLAACIGDRFNLDILAIISEKPLSEATENLWSALQVGLILPLNKDYKIPRFFDSEELKNFSFDNCRLGYRFLHDRVQQAAYSLIPDALKQSTHLKIGQLLLQNTPSEQIEANIFDIVNQLNIGIELLTEPNQRHELAQLNLLAGKKAKQSTAYEPALKYFTAGLNILENDSWLTQYQLTLDFYLEKIECNYIIQHFEKAEKLVYQALSQAKNNLDRAKINSIRLIHYQNNARYEEAIRVGLSTLELFGVTLPYSPSQTDILSTAKKVKKSLGKRKIADLIDAPELVDEASKIAILILINLVPPTYLINQPLLALSVLTMVNICLKQGNTNLSGFVYAWYGTMLCGKFYEYETGYEFGVIALKINDKFHNTSLNGRIYMSFGNFILPWRKPLKENIEIQKKAYSAAMAVGDFSWCHHSALFCFWQRLMICQNLNSLLDEFDNYVGFAIDTEPTAGWALRVQQSVLSNLTGKTESKFSLSYAGFDESIALETFQQTAYAYGISTYYFSKAFIYLIYENYAEADRMITEAEKTLAVVDTQFQLALHYIYKSLIILGLYASANSTEKKEYLSALQENCKKLKNWANNCPENFLPHWLLVEAEISRVRGNNWQATQFYDRAIASAKDNALLPTEALAYEWAAKFYLEFERTEIAETYMTKAHSSYSRWGATRKVEDLQKKYAQLIIPSRGVPILSSDVKTTRTSTASSEVLDLSTVLKASQAIASEIILDKLLQNLMKILIENAAAETGVLILNKDNQLLIEATGNHKQDSVTVLQSIPVKISADIPISLIKYVARTKEVLVLNDATAEDTFNTDAYIKKRQPKSILCTPIFHQGELSGILYLENNLTIGAFNPKRLEVLKLLSAQAAISIRNAVLYQQSQTYAQAAETANRAKSEFLANMSHELRTPLNAILGFTQVMSRDSSLSSEHQQHLQIVSRSGEHLLSLIDNILEMSKIEAGRLTLYESSFDLIRLLDTLEKMLRLRSESKGLKLIFELDADIPQYVKTDEIKLRSCLINLLGNAIKFTERGSVTLRVKGKGKNYVHKQSQLQVKSQDYLILTFEVEDTGPGIAPEEIDLLFEPFGQTETGRKSQQGTGLGLPISRKFVQLMGGDISVSCGLGKGAIFNFDIQVGLGEATEIETTQQKSKAIGLAPDQREYRILVVEDRLENRLLLTQLLTEIGFAVRSAENGQEAVTLWSSWKPDLIWMDIRMPVMNGYEATKQIRAREKEKWENGEMGIPSSQSPTIIIALTANAFEEDRRLALSVGCDDFVRKPFQESEIFEKMAQYLGVLYLYEEAKSLNEELSSTGGDLRENTESNRLSSSIPNLKEALAQMPAEWVAKLHAAAISAREKEIGKLLEEIPPENIGLAEALAKKVQDFRLDQIIDLTSNV
ncbi:AAA family ATPase [Planktothrix sp. FACHB-1355]|uniref:Circadian input-output histidine kinase CikA n=1 Tax=Aerosakkonema funiforme FACHB-1375 TaxID=2949571 RepID=A0A926ZGN6_9CYAN|nr:MULTISPECIES: hybrid sensor histidine kinase/response regulator [Oscillatoriales]MBD2181749.1 AAA family ATPase [Aerosakkonema funiforme FACHB-1375]MBD3558471.1 AAA family ATPase [Planktothrix sp. FACHB-1355]